MKLSQQYHNRIVPCSWQEIQRHMRQKRLEAEWLHCRRQNYFSAFQCKNNSDWQMMEDGHDVFVFVIVTTVCRVLCVSGDRLHPGLYICLGTCSDEFAQSCRDRHQRECPDWTWLRCPWSPHCGLCSWIDFDI